MHIGLCVCSAYSEQKRVSDALVLEPQAALSCLTEVLGTKLSILQEQHAFFTTEPPLSP